MKDIAEYDLTLLTKKICILIYLKNINKNKTQLF